MGIKTFDYDITLLDIDNNNLLTNKGILRILQEAANMASSELGYGVNDIERNQTTWALLSWHLKMDKRPIFGQKLTVKTWPSSFNKFFSMREFKLYTNDELIGVASSKWILIDTKSHKLLKISSELYDIYEPLEERVFNEDINEKYKMFENPSSDFSYTIMRRDLDSNHHVNNTVHLDIALESIIDELYKNNFSNVEIVYKKELLYKDKVTCSYKEENGKHYVYLSTNDFETLNSIIVLY